MDVENVVIVGGGPAGLSAALYLARADLKPLVIAGQAPGGQLMLTTEVENYPGFESILGPELINKYHSHAKKFGTRFMNDNIKQINPSDKAHVLTLSSGNQVKARSILIATGASALWLGIPSEQRLRGKGVSACATCDGFFFKDKIIAVVGGGDTAMEESLFLTKFATKVYVIHRRAEFRASKIMQQRVLSHPKIEIKWNSIVEEVLGKDKVDGLKLKIENSKIENLTVDGLFLAIGHKPDTKFLENGGILLDDKGYIITSARYVSEFTKFKAQNPKFKITIQNSKLEENINKFNLNYQSATSVPGIFAAGDCVDYIYRQAGTAVGMGIAAALEIEKFLE
ncbi:hypothetical protein A3J15_01075 [Candidatus Roizmanbacteria bacterium RIFCSPLOWO2_02_FULL_38_10]|uniref:FAD/NAD(P)-binding domain-containing protein n=1 Tax=Candidatus Roizmanbacteria bacterium RIFCSPLOWO2_02_FULL_38_10 TaxID=1802074 RepID=A0A1F7JPB3_9BACT|nr:MAG: hypothetical protein A3J15_01075 [Candidatus Roizmanbacteria bacterium RIFCSPLOWO2_02_FULL_38_10]